jgi:hypothetical protein
MLAVRDLLHHLTIGKILEDFLRAHAQSVEGREAGFHVFVGDFFGMKLEVDPAVDAYGHDLLHLAGTRAEGEAIQGMHRALLFARTGVCWLVFLPGE